MSCLEQAHSVNFDWVDSSRVDCLNKYSSNRIAIKRRIRLFLLGVCLLDNSEFVKNIHNFM